MIGLIRGIVIIFAILTVVYIALSQWSRWRERARLRDEYEAGTDLLRRTGTEDEYVARGMTDYSRSLRPKLFLFVYAIPGALATFLVWLAQYG
ncbi:hypothetical protein [uncultured Algimonas sp.]|uniref:hypothetical protein n=1 Tax=uncultured Algimonas sp. TaxID=1547920 RepID=UPI0026063042|nr:hypothetical protein [uncultured Algimonas sp.]